MGSYIPHLKRAGFGDVALSTVVTGRIAPLRKVEEERVRRERDAAVTAFHELLAERGVTEGTRWAKVQVLITS
jgi:hypothetical protein